jgi:hypothetical protein
MHYKINFYTLLIGLFTVSNVSLAMNEEQVISYEDKEVQIQYFFVAQDNSDQSKHHITVLSTDGKQTRNLKLINNNDNSIDLSLFIKLTDLHEPFQFNKATLKYITSDQKQEIVQTHQQNKPLLMSIRQFDKTANKVNHITFPITDDHITQLQQKPSNNSLLDNQNNNQSFNLYVITKNNNGSFTQRHLGTNGKLTAVNAQKIDTSAIQEAFNFNTDKEYTPHLTAQQIKIIAEQYLNDSKNTIIKIVDRTTKKEQLIRLNVDNTYYLVHGYIIDQNNKNKSGYTELEALFNGDETTDSLQERFQQIDMQNANKVLKETNPSFFTPKKALFGIAALATLGYTIYLCKDSLNTLFATLFNKLPQWQYHS